MTYTLVVVRKERAEGELKYSQYNNNAENSTKRKPGKKKKGDLKLEALVSTSDLHVSSSSKRASRRRAEIFPVQQQC